MLRRLIDYVVLLSLLSLAACLKAGESTLTCDQIAVLQDNIMTSFSEDKFEDWVVNTYDLKSLDEVEKYDVLESSISRVIYKWTLSGYNYSATLADGQLVEARIGKDSRNEHNGIPIREIMVCLGEPQFYNAYYDIEKRDTSGHMDFDILYPSDGVFINTYRYYKPIPQKTPLIGDGYPVDAILIGIPGSSEEVLQQFVPNATGYFDLKPWDEWENIEVDIAPKMQDWLDSR